MEESLEKNTHLKSVKIKKVKLNKVPIPESQSGLVNESFFLSKINQSRSTNASGLTLTGTHSNISLKDQSRKSLENQSSLSIKDQSITPLLRAELPSNISTRYQSKKFDKKYSSKKSEAEKNKKVKNLLKSNGDTSNNSKNSEYIKKLVSYGNVFEKKKNVLNYEEEFLMSGVSIESEVIENKFDNGNQSKIREVGKIRKEPGSKKLTQLQKYGAENKVDKKINQKYMDNENKKKWRMKVSVIRNH